MAQTKSFSEQLRHIYEVVPATCQNLIHMHINILLDRGYSWEDLFIYRGMLGSRQDGVLYTFTTPEWLESN